MFNLCGCQTVRNIWTAAPVGPIGLLLAVLMGCSPEPPAAGPNAADGEANYNGEPVSAWVARLSKPDSTARSFAAVALGRIGPPAAEAVPALLPVLEDPDPDVRANAAEALGRIGAPAAEPALPRLQVLHTLDPDPGVRREAERALYAIRTGDTGIYRPVGNRPQS